MKHKKIILSTIVVVLLLFTVICSFKVAINYFRGQTSYPSKETNYPSKETNFAQAEEKLVRELFPPAYQGPSIELNFRDDKGNRVSARKVLILPVSDPSAGGSGWTLNATTDDLKGSNCLRTALINGPVSERGLREDTEYYAQRDEKSVKLYTPQEAAKFSFRTPKLDASTNFHEIDIILHDPNKMVNVIPRSGAK